MAVVNVDLSEYDAIRKRNSELEEQVKELKKLNESLKGGSKVILRKETVLEHETDVPGYGPAGLPTYKRRVSRDVIESSESYVNFEDVRLKVEQAMKDEINRSIDSRDYERHSYAEAKSKLDSEYDLKKVVLEKEYKNKAEKMLVQARAEREANELKTASLTPAILQKMWIEKWNGSVPQVTTGGNNSTFIDISKLK